MYAQRKHCIFLVLATYLGFSKCDSIPVPHYKGAGKHLGKELFQASNIFFNDTKTVKGANDFLINTPGCYIPNYTKNYQYRNTLYRGNILSEEPCGSRGVSVFNLGHNKIRFRVNDKIMREYSNYTKYSCCYKFAYKAVTFPGYGTHTKLVFTKCIPFYNGTTAALIYEIIEVICITNPNIEIYNDAYIALKRLDIPDRPRNNTAWNIMLLGIDAMSRARLFDTMPETTKYLRTHKWLDYRGYNKVESNTFPNLMSLLTGKNASRIYNLCEKGLHKCADYFIWNKFSQAGYRTAYGEDFLELPDTLSKFEGFKKKPTDHYMRPFYLIGENRLGDILCLKMKPSATHLLSYAHTFANSYKNKQFFGMFWVNSYSHGPTDNPSKFDKEMANWFLRLHTEGILKNTFVIFFSDHGTKFGEMKFRIESYYDERLPMLFIWTPHKFRSQHTQVYTNMVLNQHRLTTPYDLYATLGDILALSDGSNSGIVSEACPQCSSLFTLKSLFRTCRDANVSQSWCSCHTMSLLQETAPETNHSVKLAVQQINNISATIITRSCYSCKPLTLETVLRSHAFRNGNSVYNVIAFQMSHHGSFEATVIYRRDKFQVLSLQPITTNSKRGTCVREINDRPYCHCIVTCK